MRAWVIDSPGGPEVLRLRQVPDPEPVEGSVRIDVEAFGLNRAEAVTRAGGSDEAVRFPRVIGVECVGRVAEAPGTDLVAGQTVAAAMGGMGRAYDGSYAEHVPRRWPGGATAVVDTVASARWSRRGEWSALRDRLPRATGPPRRANHPIPASASPHR